MTEPKRKSKALINPTEAEMVPRHFGRIKTLEAAIEKATARGNTAKVESLQAEMDRRKEALRKFKAELEGI